MKRLRREKGWAQEDLAREICVSLSTVQRWEKQGGRPIRLARRELTKLFLEAGIPEEFEPGGDRQQIREGEPVQGRQQQR